MSRSSDEESAEQS